MYNKVTVVGTGYVGLSIATLLSQTREVVALDIISEKVEKINKRVSPIDDDMIISFFEEKELNLRATLDKNIAYEDTDIVIIATPTDYDERNNKFNTDSIESTIRDIIKLGIDVPIVIKSTIPIGYIDRLREESGYKGEIFFSPEFLREGKALMDNLYPSRIVVGSSSTEAKEFAHIMREHAINSDEINIYVMDSKEAEAVKLFSNTYLAMRVSFFNELDTFAEVHNLNSNDIIQAVSGDPRIGNHYNNPSFGYGGYCLPKDTKQLEANYSGIPQNLITAIVESNQTRKEHIADRILSKKPKTVGVYKLVMKSGSDNFRQSSIIDVMDILEANKVEIIVHEPLLKEGDFDYRIENNFDDFLEKSDIIITNRLENKLVPYVDKVYTRDIFNRD